MHGILFDLFLSLVARHLFLIIVLRSFVERIVHLTAHDRIEV